MDVRVRNNITITGRDDGPVVMLAHGFGCDQNLWRHVAASLGRASRVLLFDHVGAGRSDLSAWDPSPCYLDQGDYQGGFTSGDIDELLDSLDSNYLGWSATMAPVIMGNPDRPELGQELTASFCRTDPAIAKSFARVTFLSDQRADLPRVRVPTLVVQSDHDAIAPPAVGAYVNAHIPGSRLVTLDTYGHCPQLSAPQVTTQAIAAFVAEHQ